MAAWQEGGMLTIGVDAHKRVNMAVAIDAAGREVARWRGPNSVAGWQQLAAWAAALGQDGCPLAAKGVYPARRCPAPCASCRTWEGCTMRTSQPHNATRTDLSARTAAATASPYPTP